MSIKPRDLAYAKYKWDRGSDVQLCASCKESGVPDDIFEESDGLWVHTLTKYIDGACIYDGLYLCPDCTDMADRAMAEIEDRFERRRDGYDQQ